MRDPVTFFLSTALALALAVGAERRPQPDAGTPERAALYVMETAGIRRFNYPVQARVPFEAGALRNAYDVRLLRDDMEVPAQMTAESRWRDGSVQWLSVNFNTSIGPGSTETFQVEYGVGVRGGAELRRGLTLIEDTETIRVGSLRFSKTGAPLISSVTYREEAIGAGRNGFSAVGLNGETYDLVDPAALEILKRGPLYVELQYSGQLVSDTGDPLPFVLTVGMPNSKSWVKMSATVNDDSETRLRGLSLDLPFALGAHPWVWDFGTDRWTYGALRAENDAVVLTNVVTADDGSSWEVMLRRDGRGQLYEAADSAVSGWGHIQGGGEVVAFAVEGFGSQPGTYRTALDGAGQATFGFTPSMPTRL